MLAQRRRDTGPELALRHELHGRGLRYRLHRRPIPSVRREIDIVFPRARVAVEVRGCFWHACPEHGSIPKAHAEWWAQKFQRNRVKDAETAELLAKAGWRLVVVWEHEDPVDAANRVASVVRAAK
jgi:DNA mismatch endonuclease (patch repair protein)